ncbi:lactate dehydrogenase [Vibrio sp. Of7-15]|uniref:lactate dehydrogenase n=1 Tax=Vibrio sp. Of7-15 TaxID=2724879 RepID=UPI001EF20227|nr:lactate dehydrogenase [Vibrio sp. Of7-15]
MPTGKLPPAAKGLQLNFCKTLACDNFGLSDEQRYLLQRTNPKRPALVCRECGAFPPLLNNEEVLVEYSRLKAVQSSGLPACNHPECENFGLPVLTHRSHYHAFGYSGDRQRYRCKACEGTFVDRWSGFNGKNQVQQKLLAMLFTGYAVRDICRRLHMNPKTFYDQLSHIASRCRRQMSMFDARLPKQHSSLTLASNVTQLQPNSHNGVLWISTGEAKSGYIVSQHINYSASETPSGPLDHDPYEENSRLLPADYVGEAHSQEPTPGNTLSRVDAKYREILARANVEDPLGNAIELNYPTKGAIIRPPYASYAHYLHLHDFINECDELTIYMPQEPLLRSACMTVFLERMKQKTINLIYVVEDPGWQQEQEAEKVDIVLVGWWRDRWAFTKNNNIGKGVCHLGSSTGNEAHWLKEASFRSVSQFQQRFHDQFSQLVNEPRRKLRPAGLLPLLDIYRAWHNLCRQNRTGQTPAQELGLTSSPLTLQQLLS